LGHRLPPPVRLGRAADPRPRGEITQYRVTPMPGAYVLGQLPALPQLTSSTAWAATLAVAEHITATPARRSCSQPHPPRHTRPTCTSTPPTPRSGAAPPTT
jgi:hypothetical protein